MTKDNTKLKDIDPEALLSADADEDVPFETAGSAVGGPIFGGSGTVVPFGKSNEGDLMKASFNTNESVPEHIERVRQQLGAISRFVHGRTIDKIQREHVRKLAKALFDYQLQDMQHLLMLGMDVQKKRRFVQYLEATEDIQDKIQRQSAEAQLSVVDTMFDMRLKAYQAKRERDVRFNSAYKAGRMDKQQYERTMRDSLALTDELEQRLNQTMEQLIVRHSQFLFETLALFRTDLIGEGKL